MKRPLAVRETFDAPIEYGYRFFDAPIDSPLRNAVFLTYDSAMQARDCYCQPIEKEENEGFSNKETWAVALHLDNTKWMQDAYRRLRAEQGLKGDEDPKTHQPEALEFGLCLKNMVENWRENWHEDLFTNTSPPRRKDLANMFMDVGSVWRVDWKELAEHLMKD